MIDNADQTTEPCPCACCRTPVRQLYPGKLCACCYNEAVRKVVKSAPRCPCCGLPLGYNLECAECLED